MKPKLIIEAGNMRLLAIGILNPPQHLIVHLQFLALVSRVASVRQLHCSAPAALNVMLDHHEYKRSAPHTVRRRRSEGEKERKRIVRTEEEAKSRDEKTVGREGKGKGRDDRDSVDGKLFLSLVFILILLLLWLGSLSRY